MGEINEKRKSIMETLIAVPTILILMIIYIIQQDKLTE